ncbi:hypothetical protein SDC9_03876 [bioreactor metagenome]|uniref:Uncharacterized protein n=1 Tax=bioreactor metagenome TaxID=1076179 RepID=A0A644SUP8_9ZZZZ|nr:hypothetical protein [Negativicutes bacterium]
MKKKPIGVAIILSILFTLGWAAKHHLFSHDSSLAQPKTETITIQPPAQDKVTNPAQDKVPDQQQESRPPAASSKNQVYEEHLTDRPQNAIEQIGSVDDNSMDLSDHTMSIKRTEKKGYKLMPGVNVKSKTVHVDLDKQDTKSIEIERSPSDSTSDYQLMMKKKF